MRTFLKNASYGERHAVSTTCFSSEVAVTVNMSDSDFKPEHIWLISKDGLMTS